VAAGFADGGAADVLAPGARLAGLVTAVTGTNGAMLGTLTDQEVLGVLGALQKMAAWAAWGELLALAEFARRRPAAGTGMAGARAAAEEAAWKTGESWARMLDPGGARRRGHRPAAEDPGRACSGPDLGVQGADHRGADRGPDRAGCGGGR
jgi:hypothetical protein